MAQKKFPYLIITLTQCLISSSLCFHYYSPLIKLSAKIKLDKRTHLFKEKIFNAQKTITTTSRRHCKKEYGEIEFEIEDSFKDKELEKKMGIMSI